MALSGGPLDAQLDVSRERERERGIRTSLDACKHEDDDDDSETGTVVSKIGSVFGKVPNPGNRN
jgi:hypothetical protein